MGPRQPLKYASKTAARSWPTCFLENEGFGRPAGLNEPKHFLYLPPFRQELAKAPRDLENNFEAALDDLLS